jgi:hypothetical protein
MSNANELKYIVHVETKVELKKDTNEERFLNVLVL